MKKMPPLILIEPTARQKQHRLAKIILGGSVNYSQEEVKLRLKQIRYHSVDNMDELESNWSPEPVEVEATKV